MPRVELLVVGTFEARSAQTEYLQIIAEYGLDEISGDVCGIGNALRSHKLAFDNCTPLECAHSYFAFSATPPRICAVARRRVRALGSSSANGL